MKSDSIVLRGSEESCMKMPRDGSEVVIERLHAQIEHHSDRDMSDRDRICTMIFRALRAHHSRQCRGQLK